MRNVGPRLSTIRRGVCRITRALWGPERAKRTFVEVYPLDQPWVATDIVYKPSSLDCLPYSLAFLNRSLCVRLCFQHGSGKEGNLR
jgi:hypothetical protein